MSHLPGREDAPSAGAEYSCFMTKELTK